MHHQQEITCKQLPDHRIFNSTTVGYCSLEVFDLSDSAYYIASCNRNMNKTGCSNFRPSITLMVFLFLTQKIIHQE